MYINKLQIYSSGTIIRDIKFHSGINLIVDQENIDIENNDQIITGNGVGKTTVLRLIDYCFGKKANSIYTDPESNVPVKGVKEFLTDNKVLIKLVLSENPDAVDEKTKCSIERNFLTGNQKIQRINGKEYANSTQFPKDLGEVLFNFSHDHKPTFRQVTARSFRIDPPAIDNTLKFLGTYTNKTDYETLFLFMFGIDLPDRTPIVQQIKSEESFLKQLQLIPREQLAMELDKNKNDIKKVQTIRMKLNIDKDYSSKLSSIEKMQYQRTQISNKLTNLNLRLSLLRDSQKRLESSKSLVSNEELHTLYTEAQELLGDLPIKFTELVDYNNQMADSRSQFIGKEIPQLTNEIEKYEKSLQILNGEVDKLKTELSRSASFKELEESSEQLGSLYELKGRIEGSIEQIDSSTSKLNSLKDQLANFDNEEFSDTMVKNIHDQLVKFNAYFSRISEAMYGEAYGVTFEIKSDRKKKYYDFYIFSYNNSSSGKKQGEIAAFDLGYIQFARQEKIPVLDFVLYDKKELMFGKQILDISKQSKLNNVQIIFPILSDKLPTELNDDKNIVLRLSQDDKLFRF